MSIKAGGAAFVIKCTPNNQHLVGRVVTTLYRDPDGRWLCEGNLLCYGHGIPFPGEVNGSRVLFPAAWLCPINGDPEEGESTAEVSKPAKTKSPKRVTA